MCGGVHKTQASMIACDETHHHQGLAKLIACDFVDDERIRANGCLKMKFGRISLFRPLVNQPLRERLVQNPSDIKAFDFAPSPDCPATLA
jgi:hypothetical protein